MQHRIITCPVCYNTREYTIPSEVSYCTILCGECGCKINYDLLSGQVNKSTVEPVKVIIVHNGNA